MLFTQVFLSFACFTGPRLTFHSYEAICPLKETLSHTGTCQVTFTRYNFRKLKKNLFYRNTLLIMSGTLYMHQCFCNSVNRGFTKPVLNGSLIIFHRLNTLAQIPCLDLWPRLFQACDFKNTNSKLLMVVMTQWSLHKYKTHSAYWTYLFPG